LMTKKNTNKKKIKKRFLSDTLYALKIKIIF
jgi:hypothetical protein